MRVASRLALALALVFAVVGGGFGGKVASGQEEEEQAFREAFESGIRLLQEKKFDESVAAFKKCIEIAPDDPTAYYNIACACSLQGNADQAFEWLERAIEKGFDDVGHMARDTDLDPIRKDPRYQDMIALARGERPAPRGEGTPESKPGTPGKPGLVTLKGEPASLEKLKGKVVILDFWRTWCGPCKAEIPHFVELQREYGDRGLAIVGVSDEPSELQEKFADQLKVNYTLLLQQGELPAPFDGIDVFPTTFVLDKDGKVIHKFVGLRPKKAFEDAIRPLLGLDGAGTPAAKPEEKGGKPQGRLF